MDRPAHNKKNRQQGVAVLPVVLLVGGVIVEIGIAGAFIAFYVAQAGFGTRLSNEALGAARSGIEDGIMKVVRDKDYSSATTTVTFGMRTADVSIVRDIPSIGKDTITSIGKAGTGIGQKQRKLQSIINVNQTTGEVQVEWIREVTL